MNRELLALVEVISNEKNVNPNLVFEAVELSLAQISKKTCPFGSDIYVKIDRKTGNYETFRRWLVVKNEAGLQNPNSEELLMDAQEIKPEIQVGEYLEEKIDSVEIGRRGATIAKQIIVQKIGEAEREAVITDFISRGDKIFSGTVKSIIRGDVILESGKVEARLKYSEIIPRENFRKGDKVRAMIMKVDLSNKQAPILLSRTSPEFMIELFTREVPEIEQGLLEIKSCVRDPGSRAKMAVLALEKRIDPVGTCVGIRGSRANAITKELRGEKVDVVIWSSDPAEYVMAALAPARVNSIMIDEEKHLMDVVVDEENLAIAIGRGGQNVRLAGMLTGWKINVMDQNESIQKQEKENLEARNLFIEHLDVDGELADILIQEGFSSLEEIAYIPVAEMLEIDALDEEIIEELRNRAKEAILTLETDQQEKLSKIEQGLKDLINDNLILLKLAENKINTLDDLGGLALDELVEITGQNESKAKSLIMKVRESWFTGEVK